MAAAIGRQRGPGGKRKVRVLRTGLIASGSAFSAFMLSYCTGNRDVGFGKTISRTDQLVLLIAASLLFAGFSIATTVRMRARRKGK